MSDPHDITQRLRGRYALGPIMTNGEPEFGFRQFDDLPPIQFEAADEIERLRAEVEALKACWDKDIIAYEKTLVQLRAPKP